MKIVFLGFASSFTPGMTYQDNLLCDQALKDGHEVVYLSNPEGFVNGKLQYIGPQDTMLDNGMHLIRLDYEKCVSRFLTIKLRRFKKVYDILEKEKPDVIFCHNSQYTPVLDAARYAKNHENVRLYVDTHTDTSNSGKNFLSLMVLHRIYYRRLLRKALPYITKYLYISVDTKRFAIENYGVPDTIMEYYPLGGRVRSEEDYQSIRRKKRNELGIRDDEKLFLHSGKLSHQKKTKELIEAYMSVEDKSKLVVIGSISEDQKETLLPLIEQNERIVYLGWKSGEELNEYLCACDMYCQPGSASATMQNAICCNCAIMAYPLPQYMAGFGEYGNILWVKDTEEIKNAFRILKEDESLLGELKEKSKKCAIELLDYRKLAGRIYKEL